VGVARTANYTAWGEAPQFCIYLPLEQNYSDTMALYVRTTRDPLQQIPFVERTIHAAGPQIVVTMPRTGRQIVDGGLFSPPGMAAQHIDSFPVPGGSWRGAVPSAGINRTYGPRQRAQSTHHQSVSRSAWRSHFLLAVTRFHEGRVRW
jgi:hypothetical protein